MASNALYSRASGAIHSMTPMDVGAPGTSTGAGAPLLPPIGGQLKRCSSAPMINALSLNDQPMIDINMADTSALGPPSPRRIDHRRVRHFSSSSVSMHATAPPVSSLTTIKIPTRLHQIKNEVKQDANRETASEKEFQSTMQISQSWEELRLDESLMNVDVPITPMQRQRSLSESVHIHPTFFSPAGSPSPTRVGKQCFSPAMQAPVRNLTLTPSPSPSPTRKTFSRSLSPIAIKPSTLGMKRKLDCDGDFSSSTSNYFHSPAKKFSSSGPNTPDRQFMSHPLAQSISSSHLEETAVSGHDQALPSNAVPAGAGAMGLGAGAMGLGAGLLRTTDSFSFRPVVSVSSSSSSSSSSSAAAAASSSAMGGGNACANDHPMTNSH